MTENTNPNDTVAQLDAVRSARLGGTLSEKDYFAAVERLAPFAEKGQQAPAPASGEQSRATADALRQQRMEGKISQADYLAKMEQLHTSSESHVQVSDPVQAEIDAALAPAQPHEYDLPRPDSDLEAAGYEQVRAMLSEGGVPKQWGGQITQIIDRNFQRFADASPASIGAHVDSVVSQLKAQWGADYDAKVQRINHEILKPLAEKRPWLSQLLTHRPEVFNDVWLFTTLDNIAEARARRVSK